MLREDLLQTAIQRLVAEFQPEQIWLFGSCARGEVMQHSDIDIAILPRTDLPPEFFAALSEQIEESSIPYDVDLVDLRRAAPTLVEEVRREGVKWRD